MKFSDIKKDSWEELKPYLDTCLLPLTGLTGVEEPWDVTIQLEKLRDLMDLVEIPFKGRVVTYPAVQYIISDDSFPEEINTLCERLKNNHFKHIILITANPSIAKWEFAQCDLFITPDLSDSISSQVYTMWNKVPTSS